MQWRTPHRLDLRRAEGAGAALIANNRVSGTRQAGVAGMTWTDVVNDDLARDAALFPQLMVSSNRVG